MTKVLPVLGLLGALLSAPCTARASSSKSGLFILETIGIGIAVGTVLGASTLPFYDQPGDHTRNIGIGTLAGGAIGIGWGLIGWLSGGSDEGFETALEKGAPSFNRPSTNTSLFNVEPARPALATAQVFSHRAQLWMPLVSLTW